MPGKTSIKTGMAPAPVGNYPHARRAGRLLFLSGIGPRPAGGGPIDGVTLENTGCFMKWNGEPHNW